MIETILLIICITSLVLVLLLIPFGIYEYITGPKGLDELFKKIHFPVKYKGFVIILLVSMVVMMGSFIALMKLNGY